MLRTHWIAAAAVLLTAVGPADGARQTPPQPEAPAGEGVLCAAMIYTVIAETGRRCHPDKAPEFQEDLRQSVARLDAYILANSDMDSEAYARFKAEQSGADIPDAEFCANEFGAIFTDDAARASLGPSSLSEHVDGLVARPGPPTWGTCI